MSAVLEVADLSVQFRTDAGMVPAVNDVSFTLDRGETLALVGESGSGKSVTSLAIMRLTTGQVRGRVVLREGDGAERDLLRLPEPEMREIRGSRIAMIFQEPATSLNPVLTLGEQIAEPMRYHRNMARSAAWREAERLLDLVGIPEARRRLVSYPHQLSGGMRQRAMIAIALACEPAILIADEPTTALDVTVQAQILELLRELQARTGMALMFITHNLGVVAEIADKVVVMYAGRVVEQAPLRPLFERPLMPYTLGLLRSVPRLSRVHEKPLRPFPATFLIPRTCRTVAASRRAASMLSLGCASANVPALDAADAEHLVRCVRWRELVPA